MSLFLYSSNPSYSASGLLAYALNKYCTDTVAWFKNRGTEGFDQYYKSALYDIPDKMPPEVLNAEQWLFCGGKSYFDFSKRFPNTQEVSKDKKIKIILTDSQFCRKHIYPRLRRAGELSGACSARAARLSWARLG